MTGYTANLVEKDLNFNQFVWSCARAFGALIMIRDESMDAKIDLDELFKPSDYYVKSLAERKENLAKLKSMSQAERLEWAKKELEAKIEYCKNEIESAKNSPKVDKLEKTLEEVQLWNPPTTEHFGLKEFMINQIQESLRYEKDSTIKYNENALVDYESYSPEEFFNMLLESAETEVVYTEESLRKEIEMNNVRRKWVEDLIQSVGDPS